MKIGVPNKRPKYHAAKNPAGFTKPTKADDEGPENLEEDETMDPAGEAFEILPTTESINVRDNRIFFYGDVTDESALSFNMKLRELESRMLRGLGKYNVDSSNAVIELHINSLGGIISAGFAMCHAIKQCKIPVDCYVDGECASAATLIFLSGRGRYMYEHSMFLIHQLSTWWGGTFHNLKDEMENSKMVMEKIKTFYLKRSTVPAEKLDEILEHDLWWDSETCLGYGLIDKII
jgi:ATP-dependent protease ClpP protease subunit